MVPNTDKALPATSNSSVPGKTFYTEEDLERVRSQEKNKLYSQLEEAKNKVSSFEKEKEEATTKQTAAAKELAEKAAQEERSRQENELSTKELLAKREQEWQSQFDNERAERESAFAQLAKEQEFARLNSYKSQRVESERDNIMPELIDLVGGSSAEEVDASIESLKERTAKIIDSVQQTTQTARRDMVGTKPTLPTTGPMDNYSENRNYTAAEIAAMPMDVWAKVRGTILSPTARGKTTGLFGTN